MLSLLTYRTGRPASEPADRDPGIITLAFAALAAVRRRMAAGSDRAVGERAQGLGRLPHPLP